MANAIPKGYFECPNCKNPWMKIYSTSVVFSQDKTRIMRIKTTYECEKCEEFSFATDEKVEPNG